MSNAENLARLGLMLNADQAGLKVTAPTADESDTSDGLATNAFVKRIALFPGVLVDYAGMAIPPGYLWCDGAAVSRTTYAKLFAAITAAFLGTTSSGSATITSVTVDLTAVAKPGMPLSGPGVPAGATVVSVSATSIVMSANATASASGVACSVAPWGVGNGTTTFNVPDFRGRLAAGRDDMGGVAASRMTASGGVAGALVGASGGTETHTLTSAQIPSHTHSFASKLVARNSAATAGSSVPVEADGASGASNTLFSGSAGSGLAHPIVQPTAVCNKIIKT